MDRIVLLLLIFLLQGCPSGYARLTYDFEKVSGDENILYETNAKDIAGVVLASLSDSIAHVRESQFAEFKDASAIKVYIFSHKERYARFSGASPLTRGSATRNEVYISPIIRERMNTLEPILMHELSHIHLRQYIGAWRYWTEVPGWFHEGLAVEVSGGGGAEKVSDVQGMDTIKSGKHFIPRERSDLLGHRFASDYGLEPQMYYRQSNLFVRYLINLDPSAFRNAYLDLLRGSDFGDIWLEQYGKPVPVLWQEFLGQVREEDGALVVADGPRTPSGTAAWPRLAAATSGGGLLGSSHGAAAASASISSRCR